MEREAVRAGRSSICSQLSCAGGRGVGVVGRWSTKLEWGDDKTMMNTWENCTAVACVADRRTWLFDFVLSVPTPTHTLQIHMSVCFPNPDWSRPPQSCQVAGPSWHKCQCGWWCRRAQQGW